MFDANQIEYFLKQIKLFCFDNDASRRKFPGFFLISFPFVLDCKFFSFGFILRALLLAFDFAFVRSSIENTDWLDTMLEKHMQHFQWITHIAKVIVTKRCVILLRKLSSVKPTHSIDYTCLTFQLVEANILYDRF